MVFKSMVYGYFLKYFSTYKYIKIMLFFTLAHQNKLKIYKK